MGFSFRDLSEIAKDFVNIYEVFFGDYQVFCSSPSKEIGASHQWIDSDHCLAVSNNEAPMKLAVSELLQTP